MSKDDFEEHVYRELSFQNSIHSKNVIKADDASIIGKTKISVEEDSCDGVKIILKKDKDDNIKEIKFVCSCGQTKSIILDFSE